MLKFVYLYFLVVNFQLVFSENILFLAPIGSHSHHMWNRMIVLELVNKGHNVTFASPDKDDVAIPNENYTLILFEGLFDQLDDDFNANDMYKSGIWKSLDIAHQWSRINCKHTLKTEGLKTLINYPEDFKFDLIIYDITLGYCLYPLIVKFNYPPTVGVTAFLLPSYTSYHFGNSFYSSYIQHFSITSTDDDMTFYERLLNFLITRYDLYLRITQHSENDEIDARKVFGNDLPRWYEVAKHIRLVLANTDPLLDYVQPLPPNIIPVGGLHTRKPKEIPEEFQKILDNAENGVIVFSLGTLFRSDKLNDVHKRAVLEAFSRINETVIWKFESNLENLPKNVIIRKWLPQNDILSHPNVKLFIGHGGASSTHEAIYHGVPMIAVPFILDQNINAKRVTEKQLGLTIDIDQITTDYVYNKIRKVLDNPIYAENMKKTSERFRDQPQTPLERAIFWIEYILKHGSDDFLSPKARYMPYYQSAELDIIGFLVVSLTMFLLVSFKLMEKISRLIK